MFVETVSLANRKRLELEKLLQTVREGDTVVIVKLDQLSRSLTNLPRLSKKLRAKEHSYAHCKTP